VIVLDTSVLSQAFRRSQASSLVAVKLRKLIEGDDPVSVPEAFGAQAFSDRRMTSGLLHPDLGALLAGGGEACSACGADSYVQPYVVRAVRGDCQ
jgi:hypothetical protein